jgi:hypothetical protein
MATLSNQYSQKTAQSSVANLVGSDASITGYASKAAASVTDFANPAKFGSALRSKFLPKDGMSAAKTFTQGESASKPGEKDWRVRLSVPDNFKENGFLLPLLSTGGLVFPFTPSILMSHSANYTPNNPTHTNYAINSFNYSSIDSIQINGDFFVQNALEAQYWVAAVHYLRSVTKMRYGEASTDAGSPPPVVLLNGYGDFVFKNVPVVVTLFNVELPQDVDYISCGLNAESEYDDLGTYKNVAWAPAQSQLTVQLMPQYSRTAISQFNMNDFVKGNYIKGDGGYI